MDFQTLQQKFVDFRELVPSSSFDLSEFEETFVRQTYPIGMTTESSQSMLVNVIGDLEAQVINVFMMFHTLLKHFLMELALWKK